MNIFVTSTCPIQCAKFLDNKRVIKMVLETAQLLSTSLRLNGHSGEGIYKATHVNHPSAVWARKTRGNYMWLLRHFKALCDEYTRRTGKTHKTSTLFDELSCNVHLIPDGPQTPFSNNARNLEKGVDYTHIEDVTLAYQSYLNSRWDTDKHEPKWE